MSTSKTFWTDPELGLACTLVEGVQTQFKPITDDLHSLELNLKTLYEIAVADLSEHFEGDVEQCAEEIVNDLFHIVLRNPHKWADKSIARSLSFHLASMIVLDVMGYKLERKNHTVRPA